MPRKAKGVHTSPAKAGAHNLTKENTQKYEIPAEDNHMADILPIFKLALTRQDYKGKWTPEELATELEKYFEYHSTKNLKPCMATLALWLGMSKAQLYEWRNSPEKYGFKSDFVEQAMTAIEGQYIARAEKYPTANIFLLKSSHQHVETNRLDVNQNTKLEVDSDSIANMISKLGLDK